MQKWFSKIDTRDDALTVIRNSSSAFFALAGLQIVVVGLLFAIGADTDVLIDMFATALIFALFAFLLRYFNSRIVAIVLLLLVVAVGVSTVAARAGAATGGKNIILAVVGIWAGVRAVQATFMLHGKFAQTTIKSKPVTPASPRNVIVPNTNNIATKDYDIAKWAVLLKYDDDIATVAKELEPLGEKWTDEFARSFLILNDKQYLPSIVEKIIRAAKEEAERPIYAQTAAPAFDPNNPIYDAFDDLPAGSKLERHYLRRVARLPDGTVFGETDDGPQNFTSFDEWRRFVGK